MTLVYSRKLLPSHLSAEQIFRALPVISENYFWLDSNDFKTADARFSYLGVATEVLHATEGLEIEFLETLRNRVISQHHTHSLEGANLSTEFREPRFSLGWVGWLSYEFGLRLQNISADYQRQLPPATMMWVDRAVVLNHETGALEAIANSAQQLEAWMHELESALEVAPQPPNSARAQTDVARWRDNEFEYGEKITACQRAIAEGDAYLLCLTTQVTAETEQSGSEIYLRLRSGNPSHHGGFIHVRDSVIGDASLMSSSPERFLALNSQSVALTKPIKGTRPRSADSREDQQLLEDLAHSDKERAENLMVVDLMRNDFARVCEVDSVRVLELHRVESYPHVHQLVSAVTGTLKSGCDALDLFTSCFPAGSMTGTPKLSAIAQLQQLERAPRGVYSGCFGYISLTGEMDLAMVIRSLFLQNNVVHMGTGGGITSSSLVEAEISETKLKAQALLSALNAP